MKKIRLITIVCILLLLIVIHTKNEQLGKEYLRTINILTHVVKPMTKNLESNSPNPEYHQKLLDQIQIINYFLTAHEDLAFLDESIYYIFDERQFDEMKTKEKILLLKRFYNNLNWLSKEIDYYSKYFISLDFHGEGFIKNKPAATYYYLNIRKGMIENKFREIYKDKE
ncbi:hypothetical protein [Caloranaerobacter azorensis]|uniref:Uncharacterized protein n=2 Tax=Caloranaerobacter azorensis TaxID=116090 RepID=A0A6P1YEV0_9FIRM|nr:hypothetical protein [Caloranaerobacter azorensis]QIB27810.1 hypothetical protein G3A45_11255 [Caloranaerobacter azorensis]